MMMWLLSMGTGCSSLKAMANPKLAWALSDPAPMSVVVRRADAADATSREVERLVGETPTNDDSPWLSNVGPDAESGRKTLQEIKTSEPYAAGVKVVQAELWAKQLTTVEARRHASSQPAQVATPKTEPQAQEKEKTALGEPSNKAPRANANNKKAPKARAAQAEPKPDAVAAKPAEPAAAPTGPALKYRSILAAIDEKLSDTWSKALEKKRALGDAKAKLKELEVARDAKDVSESDKKGFNAKIEEIEKTLSRLEQESDKASDDILTQAKESAAKASPETREHFGAALAALRKATDDAAISNGAAALRYSLALSSMLDSAKMMAKVFIADVIEERTGKRPNVSSLTPGVTLEGTDVKLTLNGLSTQDLGKLSVSDVTSEVASRTTAWVKHAVGLLPYVAKTQDVLDFESKLLGTILDGFSSAGWKAPELKDVGDLPTS